jgi:predicted ArsR family transcriptional regulator
MNDNPPTESATLALLAEPVRRRLYELVAASPGPVDRDQAAASLGIGRPLAAFHLDRLVAGGLLDVVYRRRSGRTGPGAGRPAKYYIRAADREVELSFPPRRYRLAAEVLARGLESSGPAAVEPVLDAARQAGSEIAAAARAEHPASSGADAVVAALADNGYQPFEDESGAIRLRNCPFDALVDDHRDLTCSMNLALVGSVADGLSDGSVVASSRPVDGFCCVALEPAR